MPSNYISAKFGYKTFAFLSECATCGKQYVSFDRRNDWRTVFTCDEKTKTGMWLIYCPDCFKELEVMDEPVEVWNQWSADDVTCLGEYGE